MSTQFDQNLSLLERYKDSPHYRKIHEQAESLGLLEHFDRLDEDGYTIIPPELVASNDFRERLLDAALMVNEKRSGQKIKATDLPTTQLNEDVPQRGHWALLGEDPIFEDLIMNPAILTMGKYLCGNSLLLSDLVCQIKQKHEKFTHPLHTDQHGTPPPLPPYSQVCNVTMTLTDYTKGDGVTAIVPKSHKKGRYPHPKEFDFRAEDAPVKAIPVEAPAGSLIVWRGDTWHGSYLRENPGLRVNIIMVFTRVYMRQIRNFRAEISQELLDRQSKEFAHLIGMNSMYPFDDGKPPSQEDNNYMMAAGYNPWA